MNNQSLETYISGADFHGKRDQKVASDLISDKRDAGWDELANLSPADRAKKEAQATDWAIQILSSTTIHDHGDDNVRKIFRVLGPRTPGEIELIRAAIRKQTFNQSSLYMTLDDGLHKEDEDEAVQEMSGDPVANALAAVHNADGDADRIKEVLLALKPDQLEKLRHLDCGMDGMFAAGVKDPAAITEIIALVRGDKTQADAARLGDMLKPKAEGVDPLSKEGQDIYDKRKPANVLKEFEAMSGPDGAGCGQGVERREPRPHLRADDQGSLGRRQRSDRVPPPPRDGQRRQGARSVAPPRGRSPHQGPGRDRGRAGPPDRRPQGARVEGRQGQEGRRGHPEGERLVRTEQRRGRQGGAGVLAK